jgi:hypothetical protein
MSKYALEKSHTLPEYTLESCCQPPVGWATAIIQEFVQDCSMSCLPHDRKEVIFRGGDLARLVRGIHWEQTFGVNSYLCCSKTLVNC